MSKVFVEDTELQAIADAIREKNGKEDTYKPSQMADAVRTIESGGQNLVKMMTQWNGLFYQVSFPEETHLVLEYGDGFKGQMSNTFQYTGSSKIKSIKIIGKRVENVIINHTFGACSAELIDLSECQLVCGTNAVQGTFSTCSNLIEIKGVIDFSKVASLLNVFTVCAKLKEVTFLKNNLYKDIQFAQSPLLSDRSIQSIIDGLADLTGGTAQTITLHADVKAKLTESQISQITSKNWTLS